MPKDTFTNLSEDKKKRIFTAAVQEFSVQRYSQASINKIVKAAEISRGSFYQYFEDKEDLYLYMLTEIGKEKMDIFNSVEVVHPDADFFETYMHMFRMGLLWAKSKPDYSRIGMLMELDDSEFITKLRLLSLEGFALWTDLIERDKKRGLIKPEIDANLVVDILYTLNLSIFKEFFTVDAEEKLLKRVADIAYIIRGGIACV